MAVAGGVPGAVDDGLGEPPGLWSDPLVRRGVQAAVDWVQVRTRADAAKSVGDQELVELCERAGRQAVAACLSEARAQAAVPGTDVRAAARAIFQAGAASAAGPGEAGRSAAGGASGTGDDEVPDGLD
ncbi:hypothetical protein [Dietzia sp. 179-F 9C3 NHS]|uniref:hypothetical protein n=1 Tax=Dietzia sp. 179-F 9C3 NHS TaxID=3374295 RepID=UPI003879AA61